MLFLVIITGLFPFALAKDTEWEGAINVQLGSSRMLLCNNSRVNLQSEDILMWKTPDGKVLTYPYNGSDYELIGTQGEELRIKSVSLRNQGLYSCVLTQNNTPRAYLLRGVNLSGPLYASMNDKYEDNIIVAVISSIVFVVPLVGICAIQKFRYKTPTKSHKTELSSQIISPYSEKNGPPAGVVNPGADFSTQL